jgi:hypothetical protein
MRNGASFSFPPPSSSSSGPPLNSFAFALCCLSRYGAPGPLFCGPKAKYPFTGFWDYSKECNKPWANPPEYCDVYEGQKAGGFDNSMAVPNSMGRTDVEGCCFWGRGVIQTTVRLLVHTLIVTTSVYGMRLTCNSMFPCLVKKRVSVTLAS